MDNLSQVSPRRRLFKTREVAEILGVTPQHVHGLYRRGILSLSDWFPGGDLRVRVEDVEALIHGQDRGARVAVKHT